MAFDDRNGLFEEMGIDLTTPEMQAAIADEAEFQSLIECLVAVRKHRDLNQDQVADRMGTKQSAVSRLESGLSDVRYSTLQKYARAINMRLRTVLIGDGDRYVSGRRVHVQQVEQPRTPPSVTRVHFRTERSEANVG